MKKRLRSVNFTVQETELLIFLIESKLDIIESKKCDSVTWQEKELAWKSIETDYNRSKSKGEVFRDVKCLKLKFESLKRDIRKKERIIHYESFNMGSSCGKNINTSQHFTELERKVKNMIAPSVERQEGLSDSDQSDTKNFILEFSPAKITPSEDENFENNQVDSEEDLTANPSIQDESHAEAARSLSTKGTRGLELHSGTQSSSHVTANTHSVFHKNKIQKRRLGDEKLADAKLEIITLQKELLQQQIEKEIAQTKVFQQQYEHKAQVQELEKKHLLLKIQLTETELENAKQCKNISKVE